MWSEHLKGRFPKDLDGGQPISKRLYRFYDTILHASVGFHPEQNPDFFIIPRYDAMPPLKGDFPVEKPVTFLVVAKNSPVLFVDINPPNHLANRWQRQVAEELVREQLRYLFDHLNMPKIYGISALGSRLAYFSIDKQTCEYGPHPIRGDPDLVSDTSPVSLWDTDIMEEEGFNKFVGVVNEVKAMVNNFTM